MHWPIMLFESENGSFLFNTTKPQKLYAKLHCYPGEDEVSNATLEFVDS